MALAMFTADAPITSHATQVRKPRKRGGLGTIRPSTTAANAKNRLVRLGGSTKIRSQRRTWLHRAELTEWNARAMWAASLSAAAAASAMAPHATVRNRSSGAPARG